jgi:rSAM/selenodomain-associated transferase 2
VKIAVVIPALNEVHDIEGAIASARAPEAEIVVVDGGSHDDTRNRASGAGARVIESPPGRAGQLRAGVLATERGESDVVLFLHADTRLPSGWPSAVARALEDSRAVGGAFRLRFSEEGIGLRILEWGVRVRVALFGLPYGDQAIFARRAALEAIGGVPQVGFMEDLDLVALLKKLGRVDVVPEAVTTSARRYRQGGLLRTTAGHLLAAFAWSAGVDRDRIERWVRG